MGGLGRAPTFAATCLIYAGVEPDEAIKIVQKGRKGSLTSALQLGFLRIQAKKPEEWPNDKTYQEYIQQRQ